MIDAILGWHMNPHTCGVAKFNVHLARAMGVPYRHLGEITADPPTRPLISVKAGEIGTDWAFYLPQSPHVLLLHDRPAIVPASMPVLYADTLGIPSTLHGNADRGALDVLLFGMAHKRAAMRPYLERLGDLLARQSIDWTVSVSQGIHEGSPWDRTWDETEADLRDLFGVRLRLLGYLADDGLARELREASACALFFDPAARANNTTLWAALDARCPLITNLDADSPAALVHGQTCFDIRQMDAWPQGFARAVVGRAGAGRGPRWADLIEVVRAA